MFAPLRVVGRIIQFPGRLVIATLDGLKARNGVGPLNRFQRGGVHTFVWIVGLVVVAGATAPATPTTSTTTTAPAAPTVTAAPSSLSLPAPISTGVVEHAPVDGDAVTVATVTDGDTFQVTDGRKVRVLGIDSCEDHAPNKTPGGADATAEAESLLIRQSNKQVTLVAEPGAPDVDRYGHLLRYVKLADGSDFGVAMVGYDHTGIYQGDNDASAAYLDVLYAHDLDHAANPPSGRECGTFEPAPSPADDDHYVPIPDNDDDHNSRDGSIIPACRHKWWC